MEHKGFEIEVTKNGLDQYHYTVYQDGSAVATSAASEIGTDAYGYTSEAQAVAAAKRKIDQVIELI